MIAELKAERREVVKQIGELQKKRHILDIQIKVLSAEKRVVVSEAKKKKILPLIAGRIAQGDGYQDIARYLNIRGFRNGGKVWRGAAVESIFEAGLR